MSEISPSKMFTGWLSASGKKVVNPPSGRAKWHFAFEEDGILHLGFVERKADKPTLDGVIEVDKRYRPFHGFPIDRSAKTIHHLHVVLSSGMSECAVLTNWSFMSCLDGAQPDRFDPDTGHMVFRVSPEGYSVFDMTEPLAGNLVSMKEIEVSK